MSQHELSTLLRDHVGRGEPPVPLPGPTLRAGRRRLRTRRLVEATAAMAVLAIAGVGVGVATLADRDQAQPPDIGMDPASALALERYDAHQMPTLMDEHVRGVLEATVPDLGESRFAAYDDQLTKLPERRWDSANSLEVTYGTSGHEYTVTIRHARGEAEGDPDSYCNSELVGGFALECTVSRTDRGDVVISELQATRPMPRLGLRRSVPQARLDTVPLDKLSYSRTVKVIKSETLITYVTERLKATGRDPFAAAFTTSYADLTAIGADPELVMP